MARLDLPSGVSIVPGNGRFSLEVSGEAMLPFWNAVSAFVAGLLGDGSTTSDLASASGGGPKKRVMLKKRQARRILESVPKAGYTQETVDIWAKWAGVQSSQVSRLLAGNSFKDLFASVKRPTSLKIPNGD